MEQRELYIICNYYHYIRNYAAHAGDNKDKSAHKVAFSRIDRERCSLNTMFNKLDAPNLDDKMNFDDFILFSRSAIKLAEAYWKSIQFDYVALVEELPAEAMISFKSVRNKKERMEEKIKHYLQINYCMDPNTYSDMITIAVEKRLDKDI